MPALSYLVRPTSDHRYRSSILDYIVDVQTIENMKYSQGRARATHTTIYYTVTGEHRNINKYFRAPSTYSPQSLDIILYRIFQCLTILQSSEINWFLLILLLLPDVVVREISLECWAHFFKRSNTKDIVLSAGQKQTRDIFYCLHNLQNKYLQVFIP